ncbi:MAG: phage holin family protein [Endomicrobiales bacterium]|nr:phage holin family protein [Endomicrobiales bacterium]
MKNNIGFLFKWLVNTLALIICAKIVPGVDVADMKTAVFASLVIGLLNVFVKPLLIVITIPLTVLTFGFFILAINTVLFYGTSVLVGGFTVSGFTAAFFGAFLFSIASMLLNFLVGPGGVGFGVRGNAGRGSYGVRDESKVIEAEVVEKDDKQKLRG